MIQEIITKVEQSIQCVLAYVLNLLFQPIYCIVQIVQGIIDVWSGDDNTINPEIPAPQPTVTVYPSTNEGKYAEECDYPIGQRHIGFHVNKAEEDEIKKIKEELNK